MRLFFDLHKQESPSYDFRGHDVAKPDDAAQIAELIAADLGCSETSQWVGAQVSGQGHSRTIAICGSCRWGAISLSRQLSEVNSPAALKKGMSAFGCRLNRSTQHRH